MKDRDKQEFKTGKVIILSASHLFHDVYTAFLSPLLPLLIERFNLSLKLAGLLTPAFRSPSLIQPFVGYFADRGTITRFLPFTLFLTSLSMSFVPTSKSYLSVLFLFFVSGVSAAFYHPLALGLLTSAGANRHGTAMSFFMTGGELARSLGPLYIVTLLQILPSRFLPLAALPGIISAALLSLSISARKSRLQRRQSISFGKALKKGGKGLTILIAVGIIHNFTTYSFSLFLPTYMRELGASLFTAGSSLSILEISGAFGALLGGTISDRIGRKTFFILSGLSLPVIINLFLQSNALGYKFLFLLLAGVFMFSIPPVRYAFAQDLVPEMKATVSSLLMAVGFLATSVASVTAGAMGDTFGLFTTFRIISLLPFSIIPLILLLPEKRPR